MSSYSSCDRSLDRFIAEINQHPLLSRQEEVALAERLRDTHDQNAAHRLIICNLRFVVKTAHQYRGYGLKLLDLIQEGNMGLMIAVQKFDPDKGYRLVSYAVWWIRAYIQSFIMRAWSLVKVGTTQAQRKLFFRLRSERERADRLAGPGERATAKEIAEHLQVTEGDVNDMEMRMCERDLSLDAKITDGGRSSHLDLMASNLDSQEQALGTQQLKTTLGKKIQEILGLLNDKERYVIDHRIMRDEPPTLQEIGQHLRISRERVRQIESNVIRKLRTAMGQAGTKAA